MLAKQYMAFNNPLSVSKYQLPYGKIGFELLHGSRAFAAESRWQSPETVLSYDADVTSVPSSKKATAYINYQ